MPDDDLLTGIVASPTPRRIRPTTSHLNELSQFAKENNLIVGSTTGGTHNKGSLHYTGNAIDIKGSGGFDDNRVNKLREAAKSEGFLLRDERVRPKNQKVWGGPHVHLEYAGEDDDLTSGIVHDDLTSGIVKPTQPPITDALTKLTADVNKRTERIKPQPVGMGDVQQASRARFPTLAEARRAEEEPVGFNPTQGQPSRVTQTPDELRVIKGEQPADRQAYARQQELQSRIPEESYRDRVARETKDQDWHNKHQAEIDRETELYRQDIRSSNSDPMKWLGEFGAKAGAGLLEYGGVLSDTARIKSEAAQKAAEIESANRSKLSRAAQDIPAGFISSLPEMAAMELGVPPIVAFGAGSGIKAAGMGRDVPEAVGQGMVSALPFEIPVPQSIKNRALRGATRGATVGGATTGLELMQGKPLGEALQAGGTNALIAGLPEAGRRGNARQAETQRQGVQAEQPADLLRQGTDRRSEPDVPSELVASEPRSESSVSPRATASKGIPSESADIPAQRFQSLQFGEVEVTESQQGARKGKLRVAEVADPEKIHYVKKADAQGRGNAQLLPIKESLSEHPLENQATASPEEPPEGATTVAPPAQVSTAPPLQPETAAENQARIEQAKSQLAELSATRGEPIDSPVAPNKSIDAADISGEGSLAAASPIKPTIEGSSTTRGERSLPKSLEAANLPGGTERFYDIKSNVESESKARKIIKDRGVDGATNWVQSGEKPSLEQTATALELIKGIAREAETEANPEIKAAKLAHAAELSSVLSVRSTEAGQSIQYLYTLAKESPEGALYYAERAAKRRDPDMGLAKDARSQVFEIATRLKAAEAELESVKLQLDAAQKTRTTRKPSDVTTKLRKWADQAEKDARARLASRTGVKGSQAGATTILPDIADYSIIGAAKLARGTVEFAEWSKQMVSEFGDAVKPHLKQIRAESQKLLDEQSRVARGGKVLDEITRLGTERSVDKRVIDAASEIAKGTSRTELHRKVKASGLSGEETNQIVGRAQKLYSDANKGLRESGKERSAQKREPDASPERVRELVAERDKLLAARGKARRELIAFQRRLERGGPSIGQRLNNAYRGVVVSALQTASRNLGTQTIRTGVESLTDAFELAVVKAKVKAGGKLKEGDIDPKTQMLDTLKSSAYLLQRNKRMVNGVLDEFPVEHEQMFRRFSSDVELAPHNKLAKGADKAMGYVEKGVEIVNVFNRAQEFIGRRATFRGVLEARLRARGIDLNETVKAGKQETIPREDIQAAVDSALRVTFAESPKAGTKSDMFVRFTSSLPAPINPLTFSRFLWNGAKFTMEYQPTTALRGAYRTATGKPGAARDYAKAAVGTLMLTTAAGVYKELHKDGSEWYLLENPLTGNEFDIRPFQPFASYIFAVHFLRSKQKGEQVSYETSRMGKAGVYVEGLTGFQARPNPAWEGVKSVTTEDWPGAVTQIKRMGGETVAATLTPLKTLKQILAAFDENEGVMRDTRNRPFLDPIVNAIPKASQSLEPVTRKDQVVRQPSSLLQLFGIREIDPNTKYTRAENLTQRFLSSRYGDDERTDAEISMSKELAKLRTRSRKGEDVKKELADLEGKIKDKQAKAILGAAKKTRFQEDYNRLSAKQAAIVYSIANEAERAQVKDILERKSYSIANMTDAEQADMDRRLRALGMTPEAGRKAQKAKEPQEAKKVSQRSGYSFQ